MFKIFGVNHQLEKSISIALLNVTEHVLKHLLILSNPILILWIISFSLIRIIYCDFRALNIRLFLFCRGAWILGKCFTCSSIFLELLFFVNHLLASWSTAFFWRTITVAVHIRPSDNLIALSFWSWHSLLLAFPLLFIAILWFLLFVVAGLRRVTLRSLFLFSVRSCLILRS